MRIIRGYKNFDVTLSLGNARKSFYVNAKNRDDVTRHIEDNFVYEMCELGLAIEGIEEVF
jgi:hypothetical protein